MRLKLLQRLLEDIEGNTALLFGELLRPRLGAKPPINPLQQLYVGIIAFEKEIVRMAVRRLGSPSRPAPVAQITHPTRGEDRIFRTTSN